MELKTKRILTTISIGIFFLLGGIEYAIIMPTVYLYIEDLGGAPSFLGIVLSAFSFSGLIVAPIFGVIQDRTHKTKLLIFVANLFEVVGNFMYFVGFSLWVLLGSRLVAGIGAGVQSSIFAQIARTTTEADRASAISLAMAARQIGLLFGPGFNLFFAHVDFSIGPFKVNSYTVPGIFMCFTWILYQIFFVFCYYDLPTLDELKTPNSRTIEGTVSTISPSSDIRQDTSSVEDRRHPSVNQHGDGYSKNDDGNIDNSDYNSGLTESIDNKLEGRQGEMESYAYKNYHREKSAPSGNNIAYNEIGAPDGRVMTSEMAANTKSWTDEYLREEIVVLLATQFVFFFSKMCVETALTPMAQLTMDFGVIENSIVYCICGVEVLLCFILVKVLSRRISDRSILAIGFAIEICALVILFIFYPRAPSHNRQANIAWFSVACIIQIAGLAFCGVAIVSLYSKIVSEASQGLSQGIRRSVGSIGTILGPLWAGGTVLLPYIFIGVMLFLFLLVVCMTCLSWSVLAVPSDKRQTTEPLPTNDTTPSLVQHDEKTPLLINTDEEDIRT